MANYCGKCGAPLEAEDRFCMQCGEPVKKTDEDLTVPLKSSEEKEIDKSTNSSENVLEKKTGLAARAVRESNKNSEDINKNSGASNDDADDVLKQMETDNRQNAQSLNQKTPHISESKKDEYKPKAVPFKENGTNKAKTAPPKKNNKTIFIIIGVVLGVIAVGALIYCFATGILPPKSTVPISFKINIDDGFTKDSTLIVAKITDQSDKSKVTYTTFTPEDKNGKEIEMPQGQYEITMISPVNSDCSIYDMGKAVVIDTSLKQEREVDTSCRRIAADNVTSAQIQGIADALKEASGNENVDIPEDTLTKANDRVKTKQAEEEKQRKAAEKQAAIDNAIAQGYNVFEGTMHYCDTIEKFEQYSGNSENMNSSLRRQQLYHLPYSIFVFDINQDVTAYRGARGGERMTRSCNLIGMHDANYWQKYDGKHLTLAVSTSDSSFPTSQTPLNSNTIATDSYVISED